MAVRETPRTVEPGRPRRPAPETDRGGIRVRGLTKVYESYPAAGAEASGLFLWLRNARLALRMTGERPSRTVEIEAVGLDARLLERAGAAPAVLGAELRANGGGTTSLVVQTSDPEAAVGPLLALVRSSGASVRAVRSTEPSLDDVFFHLAGRR